MKKTREVTAKKGRLIMDKRRLGGSKRKVDVHYVARRRMHGDDRADFPSHHNPVNISRENTSLHHITQKIAKITLLQGNLT